MEYLQILETVLKILLIAVCAVQAVFESIYYIHMLQLNSYRPERYLNWTREHDDRVLPRTRLIAVVPLALIMMFNLSPSLFGMIAGFVTVVLCIISAIFDFPKKAKKPLVVTPRVKRLMVTQGILLVLLLVAAWLLPLRLCAAMLLLVVLLVVALVGIANQINLPLEKHIADGFTKDAKRILSEMPELTIIGVTGSYGKTSTKNFLHTLLSAKYNVLMTPESYNTPMGVVRTVREQLRASHEIFICEMGAKNKGDIREICDIVHPHYGVITAIGEQHLETFHTVETIIDTKFELADALPADGTVFLNTDNAYIAQRTVDNVKTVSYGVSGGADYTASDICTDENGTRFVITAPDGERCEYTTRLLGRHNIENLAGAIAVACSLGIPLAELRQPVRQIKPVPHRLQLLPNGYIDDAYNSNPAGFRSALDVLRDMKDTRRILVTPGMVELGERQAALNEELGAYAADCCDYAVLVGQRQAPPLKKGLLSKGFDEEHIFVACDLHQGLSYVHSLAPADRQVVLLENDLPDNF
ncbi:MAG: UDP-N-acetylmuramoyl-tripeptide--D-alanyl-D-alanine ligase [Acutalibacteraceae bacterium]